MKVVKKTSEYTISQRRDGRYAVVGSDKKPVNGDDKVKILLAEELIKVTAPAPAPEPEPEAEEVAAEETTEEATEEAAEEPAEEAPAEEGDAAE